MMDKLMKMIGYQSNVMTIKNEDSLYLKNSVCVADLGDILEATDYMDFCDTVFKDDAINLSLDHCGMIIYKGVRILYRKVDRSGLQRICVNHENKTLMVNDYVGVFEYLENLDKVGYIKNSVNYDIHQAGEVYYDDLYLLDGIVQIL